MKKIILVTFTLLVYNFISAQSLYSTSINNAELNFIQSKYKEALVDFSSAFKSTNNVFAKDYYNAALCAVRTKDFKKAYEYFDSLCSNGYSIKKISKNIHFTTFKKNKYYNKLASKTYIISATKKSNQTYLYNLLKDDQNLRLKNPRNYMEKESASDIKITDSLNVLKLNEFVRKNGFPNEFNCGIDSNYLNYNPAEIVIIHQQFGSQTRIYNYSILILEALKKESILPHNGLNLYSRCAGGDSLFANDCFFSIEQPNGKYKNAYFTKINNEEIINKRRLEYNLEIIEDYKKKMFYFLKHNDFIFDFSIGGNIQTINKTIAPYIKGITYFE